MAAFLRYAERLYLKLGDFHAESFEELFDGDNALPLEAVTSVRKTVSP